MASAGSWRVDLNSLSFQPAGHDGFCFVHLRAFGTLMGRTPLPSECEQYFRSHGTAFQQAAAAKIQRARLTSQDHFHLNSRDVMRELRTCGA